LCHGRRQEELRAELAKASSAEDALTLQQLIDDSLRSGIAAREMQPARNLSEKDGLHRFEVFFSKSISDAWVLV